MLTLRTCAFLAKSGERSSLCCGLALLLFIHLISISFIERAWGNKGRRRVVDGDLKGHDPTFAWLSFMTNICNQIILSVGVSILHSWIWYQELCHVHPPEKHTKHWWFRIKQDNLRCRRDLLCRKVYTVLSIMIHFSAHGNGGGVIYFGYLRGGHPFQTGCLFLYWKTAECAKRLDVYLKRIKKNWKRTSCPWILLVSNKTEFILSLHYRYDIKQTSNENKAKYQLEEYWLIPKLTSHKLCGKR